MDKLLEVLTVEPQQSILEALCKIDRNQRGFLIVVSPKEKLLGTLTDGDIRRRLVEGVSVQNLVEDCYQKRCRFIYQQEDFSKVIDLFKEKPIEFLPILDQENRLVNVITKKQLHAALLRDLQGITLDFDFLSLDEMVVDYEIFRRPWGFYKTTVLNDYFQSKVIHVRPQAALSLQLHKQREEYWIVVHGTGQVQLGDSRIEVRGGSSLFIPKGCKHQLVNTSKTETLIVTEVQIGEYFGEDDIIRLEDQYGRV